MSMYPPFSPGACVKLVAGAASAFIAFPDAVKGNQLVIYNSNATVPLVILLSQSAAPTAIVPPASFTVSPAPIGTMTIAPGSTQTITRGDNGTIAYIRDGASDVTFYMNVGEGE